MSEEIKVGDKVRVSEDVPAMYVEGINRVFAKSESEVEVMDDGNARIFIETEDSLYQLVIPCKYLVKVGEDRPKTKVGAIEIPVKLDFDEPYWQDYEAQLAHDIAVKIADKDAIDTPMAADSITDFAKRITENLKRK